VLTSETRFCLCKQTRCDVTQRWHLKQIQKEPQLARAWYQGRGLPTRPLEASRAVTSSSPWQKLMGWLAHSRSIFPMMLPYSLGLWILLHHPCLATIPFGWACMITVCEHSSFASELCHQGGLHRACVKVTQDASMRLSRYPIIPLTWMQQIFTI